MSVVEQLEIKTKYYNEALRYMDNAKETLQKASKDGNFYQDTKYVRTACGIAYNAVLDTFDCYFKLKGVPPKKGRKSIEYYQVTLTAIDKKMLDYLNESYRILHLSGYYEGSKSVKLIGAGFEIAYEIIEKIKP